MSSWTNHYQCAACDEIWSKHGTPFTTDACPNKCVLFVAPHSVEEGDEPEAGDDVVS
jgi:hypothetical protein